MLDFGHEIQYLIIFSSVLIFPKIIQRFKVPVGITCLALGIVTSSLYPELRHDQLLLLLSRLGITSLFLFAGMEVKVDELKEHKGPLLKHLGFGLIIIFGLSMALQYYFDLDYRVAVILSLGLLTPSTGFILNSLDSYKLTKSQRYWISSKSISEEMMAVLVLFFAMQSHDLNALFISIGVLFILLFGLPIVFRLFIRYIAPYAPKSEVAFLIILALLCGVITKKIGTYYLVGAFIVGIVAGRFKHFMDEKEDKNIFEVLSVFFGIFIPFYFYKSGLNLSLDILTKEGVIIGAFLSLYLIPLRYYYTNFTTINFLGREVYAPWKVSLSLMPTLIFGLVISTILLERYQVKPSIVTGLFIYTIISSILPAFAFETNPPEEYDSTTIE
jgi:Kef-type K+ transport system membrane component KefB